jgi:uncharacterized protein (TIGR03083 family)
MIAATAGLEDRRVACETVAGRIAAMITAHPDPARRIPRSDWTVGEAAAHLAFTTLGLAMMARGLAIPYGDGTRAGLAEANAVALDGYSERDLATLAAELIVNTRIVFQEAAAAPPDQVCLTPMGTVGLDGLTAYVLTHQAMHGSAIATALGAPLPFDADHLPLMWPFLQHALGQVLASEEAAGLTASFALRVTGSFSVGITLSAGRLTFGCPAPAVVDCELSGDPQVLFLLLIKLLDAGEALQAGTLHLSGPRAELGLRLMELFDVP